MSPDSGEVLLLRVEAPICAFRPFASREYQDTYPVPTPASVYGMLLSYLGVERHEKHRHAGVRMALALEPRGANAQTVDEALPWRSSLLRKLRRVSQYGYNKLDKNDAEMVGQFVSNRRRPDYQDVLADVTLWIWLEPGNEAGDPPLPMTLKRALDNPACVGNRHGGLSLGESSYLVNSINRLPYEQVRTSGQRLVRIVPDDRGFYSLPIWTDHVGDRTTYGRFGLEFGSVVEPDWFSIAPRETGGSS